MFGREDVVAATTPSITLATTVELLNLNNSPFLQLLNHAQTIRFAKRADRKNRLNIPRSINARKYKSFLRIDRLICKIRRRNAQPRHRTWRDPALLIDVLYEFFLGRRQ